MIVVRLTARSFHGACDEEVCVCLGQRISIRSLGGEQILAGEG